jgi:hypothetical protein
MSGKGVGGWVGSLLMNQGQGHLLMVMDGYNQSSMSA